jgi:rhomboid protease GluP
MLIGIMVAAFAATVLMGGEVMWGGGELFEWGAQYAPAIWAGEWWRLVTAIFLHGGVIHLLVNSVSLLALGRVLEPTLGWRRYLVLFFVSGVVSGLASLVFVTDVPSVGASGAVFGLAGLLLADELTQRRLARRAAAEGRPPWRPRASIVPVLVLNLALGAAVPAINNYAHVGGLVAGFLLGTAWIERNLRNPRRSRLALAALLALSATLAVLGFRPAYTGSADFNEGVALSRAGRPTEALTPLSRAIERSGGRDGRFFAQRAIVHFQLRDYDAALADVERALALEPSNARFRYLRAGIRDTRGEMAGAVADARAACEGGVEEACEALQRREERR